MQIVGFPMRWLIYINFVVLHSFHAFWNFGSGEDDLKIITIYGHGPLKCKKEVWVAIGKINFA